MGARAAMPAMSPKTIARIEREQQRLIRRYLASYVAPVENVVEMAQWPRAPKCWPQRGWSVDGSTSYRAFKEKETA
jgi:hypothetical protein